MTTRDLSDTPTDELLAELRDIAAAVKIHEDSIKARLAERLAIFQALADRKGEVTNAQIAAAAGVVESAVRVALHTARKRAAEDAAAAT